MPRPKGSKLTEEHKYHIGKSMKGNKNAFKGDNIKIVAIHKKLRNYYPQPKTCERCGRITDKLDLASKTHKYTKDINEYRWLCRSCHMIYDFEQGFRKYKNKNKEMNKI